MARTFGKPLQEEAGLLMADIGSDWAFSNTLEGPVYGAADRARQKNLRGFAGPCPAPDADALFQADNRPARRKFPTRPIWQEKDDTGAVHGKGCLHRWMKMKADCESCLTGACVGPRAAKAVLAPQIVSGGGKKEPALMNEAGSALISVVAGIDHGTDVA